MAEERQTCPRRAETHHAAVEGVDSWTSGHGLIGQDQVGPSCSYCGSLHPDRFMELVREGWLVGPTDKSYKAYLARPYTDEEQATRKAQWMSNDAVAKAVRELGERDGKTEEQITADLEMHWIEMVSPVSQSGATEAKFYFQHLSQAQRDEFIALHNASQMKFGYPGHLYLLPFFAQPTA